MSRASEFSLRLKEVNSGKPKFYTEDEEGKTKVSASVDSLGLLNTYDKVWTSDESLALAKWINEIFGEEKP